MGFEKFQLIGPFELTDSFRQEREQHSIEYNAWTDGNEIGLEGYSHARGKSCVDVKHSNSSDVIPSASVLIHQDRSQKSHLPSRVS